MHFGVVNGLRAPLGSATFDPTLVQALTSHLRPTATANQSTENAQNQATEGFISSDGRLQYTGGQWRVRSDDSSSYAGKVSQSAEEIIAAGYPIFIGPIPWGINGAAYQVAQSLSNIVPTGTNQDLTLAGSAAQDSANQSGIQITTISDPVQIPKGWGDWFAGAFDSAVKAGLKLPAGWGFAYYLPYINHAIDDVQFKQFYDGTNKCCHVPVQGSLSCTTPATLSDGSANTRGVQMCTCTTDPGCYKWRESTPAQPVTDVASGPDANNFPAQWVKYAAPNDVYTYKWFYRDDWANAFKPGLASQNGIAAFLPDLTPYGQNLLGSALDNHIADRFFNYNTDPTYNVPPSAKFRHPVTGDTWGIWFAVSLDSPLDNPGSWNVHIDLPNSFSLKVGIGPLPSEPWYDYIVDAVVWMVTTLANAAIAVVGAIQSLVCSNPQLATGAAQGAAKTPNAGAQATALGIEGVLATCPQPPTPQINCSDPAQAAINPICQPPVTPWYEQWYVIVGALAIAGFAILSLSKPSRPERST